MPRFSFILLTVFWCASLSITVFQQSSVLTDLKTLWNNRIQTEIGIESKLNQITNALQERRNQQSNSAASVPSLEDLLSQLEKIEQSAKQTVSQLEQELNKRDQEDEEQQQRLAKEQDQEDHVTKKHNNRPESASRPRLKPMQTECKNYGALDALRHLIQNVRSKIYEPNAGDTLRLYAEEGGQSPVNLIKMDPQYASLNVQVEEVLDHLEKTMPEILDLWSKWFKDEEGDPVPAPTFLSVEEGGEVHPSETLGRKAYDEVMSTI